jgi:hypothetical protein
MRYERLLLMTHHGFDGKDMQLGRNLGNTTEYDQEAAICGLIWSLLIDEKKRCEYLPKTKRQWERPCHWKRDLPLSLRCSFAAKQSFFEGDYRPDLADAFPRFSWRGSGEATLVLGRGVALQPAETTARDILRGLLFLL